MQELVVVLIILGCTLVQFSAQQQGSGVTDGSAGCSSGEFQCPISGVCIAEELICNGREDCSQGEDESVCPSSCFLDQFRCGLTGTCISLSKVCDGVSDCGDGGDEVSCDDGVTPGSVCAGNQFPCSLNGPCIPLAHLCDGMGDCPNGDDESRCEQPEVELQVPESLSFESGDTITLSCDAIGYPPPFVTWRKNLEPLRQSRRHNFTSQNGFGVLRISNAGREDAGVYHCEVVSELHGARLAQPTIQVEVTDSSPAMCVNHLDERHREGSYYYDVRPVGVGPAAQAAADIIFVVDESGSMALEHEWLREEVRILDRVLKSRGVGAGERCNLFALVGFGRNDPRDIFGVTLTQLTPANDFIEASMELMLTGAFEDGYSAIDYALNNIATRESTAKQIILITDEDRGVLLPELSRDAIERTLRESGFVLNVVVNQAFHTSTSDDSLFALGVSNGVAYVFDPFSEDFFSTVNMDSVLPSSEIGFGDTFEDYVVLALRLGGAAWDLNQLREEGMLARAFTNAFTEIKTNEIMTVFFSCFECLCLQFKEVCSLASNINFADCIGTFPVLRSAVTPESILVKSGSTVSFECLTYSNFENLSVSFEWLYPPELEPAVTANNEVLVVRDVDFSSEVVYTCVATSGETGLVSRANSTIVIDTRCQLEDWSYLVLGDMRLILAPRDSNVSRAADIVLLVDESGSMTEEHQWISMMTQLLDRELMAVDVGRDPRNQFGMVGFGDDCDDANAFGRVLLAGSAQEQFAAAENVTDFTQSLNVEGRREDGYSAMNLALESYNFRNVAKQFILITDEDRDVLAENLTRDSIQAMLEEEGVQLNAVISEEFTTGDLRALGLDAAMNAYVYDPSVRTSFRVVEGSGRSVEDSAFGSTSTDYTELALELGGASWDLSQLRQGGGVAEAFTSAFVQVKVLEIQSQLSVCMNCTCGVDGPVCSLLPSVNFSFCMRTPDPQRPGEMPLGASIEGPSEVTVLPSETRSFTCQVNSSAVIRWTFNGGNLPSNVITSGTGGYRSVLTLAAATSDNEGQYSCLAHSQSGAFNAQATVQVRFYDPEQDLMLVISPLQPVVTVGDNATILCNVASPSLISWMFNDGPLPLNSIVTTNTTVSELTLVAVEFDNEGAYTCVADSVERSVVNDDTSYLDIREPRLRLLVDPDLVVVDEGMDAQLVCKVDCFCPDVVPVWTRADGAPLSTQATVIYNDDGSEMESVLMITQVSPEDSGFYVCSGELDGVSETAEAHLTVVEGERFTVLILGESQVDVEEGDSFSAVCESSANASSIAWLFNGTAVRVQGGDDPTESSVVPDNVVAVGVSQVRSVLSIIQANTQNDGTYQCVATSEDDEMAVDSIDIAIII